MLLVSLNPINSNNTISEVTNTISEVAIPQGLAAELRPPSKSPEGKELAPQPEKVPNCAPGYLGPYRSEPNFTHGKRIGPVVAKNHPQSIYPDSVHISSTPNHQIVVAKKKQTKRFDHSRLQSKKQGVKLQTPPHHRNRRSTSARPEKKTIQKYRPGTLALWEI